jgi:hypothetical protein
MHVPPQPGTDLPPTADSNIPPNIALGTGCTDFVNDLIRLQIKVASDDFFLDLGGAAEDRLDAAEPPQLTFVPRTAD